MAEFTRNLEWRQRNTEYSTSDEYDQTTAATTDTCVITHPYVKLDSTAGAVTTFTLPNGSPGQMLKIELETDGGNVDVVPATASGWSKVELDDAGDSVVLLYANDTTGWVILAAFGLAAQPAITAEA